MVAHRLDQLPRGASARIEEVGGDDTFTQRIMALGLLPGQLVRVVGIAPMGDPITIEGPNGRVSLRRLEASRIAVTPLV